MTEPITASDPRYAQCPLCWDLVWEEHFFIVTNAWTVARTALEISLTGHKTGICLGCFSHLAKTVPRAPSNAAPNAPGPDITGHVESEHQPDCPVPDSNYAHS